jgi:hypothetical protein
MKEETLEDAAENHHNTFTKDLSYAETRRESFIEGAKWQQKRMYSEEEVYNLLEEAMKDCYTFELEYHHSGDYKNLKEWFEQYKKKFG